MELFFTKTNQWLIFTTSFVIHSLRCLQPWPLLFHLNKTRVGVDPWKKQVLFLNFENLVPNSLRGSLGNLFLIHYKSSRDKAKLPLVKFIITLAIVSNTAGITYALKPSPALSWVIKKVQSSGRPCFNPVNVILWGGGVPMLFS